VTNPPTCPRCLGELRPPDLWSSQWRCDDHGEVLPYHVTVPARRSVLANLVASTSIPLWVPWPMPVSWYASGLAWAGDERTGPRATTFAASGPSPVGGPADLVMVAEVPGVGVGARLAGLDGPDPEHIGDVAESKVEADGRPTALWSVASPADRAAFVGEARGMWLWVVLWPADAALLLLEHIVVRDLSEAPAIVELLDFGAPSPYLGSRHRGGNR
jgi:hypothetical protein